MRTKMGLCWFIKVALLSVITLIGAFLLEISRNLFALILLSLQFFFAWCIGLVRKSIQPRRI